MGTVATFRVKIRTSPRETRNTRMYPPGDYVRLRVADSGEGMDKATLSRIFEPFLITKKAGFGSGLGLATVHSIIVLSGGHISATSEVGLGTAFEILLPRTDTLRRLSERSESLRSVGERPPPTVLRVDDEDSVRSLMYSLLAREGYRVREAGDAREAQAIAESFEDRIHVPVTDTVVPGMPGPELAQTRVSRRHEMKAPFVSRYQHDTIVYESFTKQGSSVLPKPFGADFRRRVQMLWSGGSGVQ